MTARYEERRLVVAIADTGKGMEPADRERIFQEFTRLPGAQGKEGFGLRFVYCAHACAVAGRND